MKNYKKIFALASVIFAFQAIVVYAQKAPKWVDDCNSVYPDKDWVAVVETGRSKAAAEANAAGALAGRFKLDVEATNQAVQSISQTVSGGKSSLSKSNSISQQTDTKSSVNGLMGIKIESFVPKNGDASAVAYMNRKEGGTLYANIVKENDKVITGYMKDAAGKPGTFEAYEYLAVADTLAVLTDNYLEILSVLNPAVRDTIKVGYGNANNIKKLALANNSKIIISVQVDSNYDDVGRVKKALQKVFTSRGFKTSDSPSKNAYILETTMELSAAQIQNENKFVRYEITAAIADPKGDELFAFSDNGREGHKNYDEAAQRAVRKIESSIGDADDEESFISAFNNYLLGLLK